MPVFGLKQSAASDHCLFPDARQLRWFSINEQAGSRAQMSNAVMQAALQNPGELTCPGELLAQIALAAGNTDAHAGDKAQSSA